MILQNNFSTRIKTFIILLITTVTVCQLTFAQDLSVDEIIKKNIEARGGEAAWKNIKTVKMTGTYVNFSNPEDFVMYRSRPDLYRFDTKRLNRSTIHAFDGKNAWWVNPLMGASHSVPNVIPSENNLDKVTLRERFFEPVFWNYKSKGNAVELIGKENVDGDEVYKIKVTLKDNTVENWYISSDTFLEVSMEGETYDFGTKNKLEAFFSNYKTVDGIVFPFLIESEYGIRYRSLEVDKIEINKNVESSVFNMPDPKTWKK